MSDPNIYVTGARDDYWLATIPAVMGCNASGKTRDEAIENVRHSFHDYVKLLEQRGVTVEQWKGLDPARFPVAENPAQAGGLFPEDKEVLEEHDVRDFLHIFEQQHAALFALLREMSPDELERNPDADSWSVREALEHMMNTQATLLSRLERWPKDPFNTMQAIHRVVFQRFTVMEPKDETGVRTIRGRPWNARRVMRRILEHQWEHYGHILEILDKLAKTRKS